ncbi:MAG TPA: aminotransferase class IV, partial [Spirochaetia bacterium]|nr:aminotransferase class IV [Spirochaetia bacterium]
MSEPVIWIDGNWKTKETAAVSVYDHGLLYGDGIFEGMRIYAGKIFRLDDHLVRFDESARALLLDLPYTRADLGAMLVEA